MTINVVDLVKIKVLSTGTGALSLGDAVSGYRGLEGLTNGLEYSYSIQQGADYEIGKGTYLATGNLLVRSPTQSSNGGAALDLQPNATVAFVLLAADLQQIKQGPAGTPGPAGPAGNVAATLADLKAAPITNVTMLYDQSTWTWTEGDYSGTASDQIDVNVVFSDDELSSVGAWIRQLASKVALSSGKSMQYFVDLLTSAAGAGATGAADGTNVEANLAHGGYFTASLSPAGAPAIKRLTRDRLGEVVSVKDYVVGDGNADDSEAYQALINAQPAEITYPQGCAIALPTKVLWTGDMTHRLANGALIIGDVADYAVQGLGYPDQSTMTVTAPISRGDTSFPVSGTVDLAPGDDFYLYDTSTDGSGNSVDHYDFNVVRAIVGGVVYTKRPIGYAFPTAANTLIYDLSNACRNVKVIGGEFRNVSTDLSAKAIGFLNSTDCSVSGVTVTQTGGNGISFEGSMRCLAENVAAIGTGRVGLGFRHAKDFRVRNFFGRFPNGDESLTFYRNCGFGTVSGVDIEQYLSGEAPAGNAGGAGNCVLFDTNCSDITISTLRLRGSATYPVFITNASQRIRVENFDIAMANLGGIRCSATSNDNRIGKGRVTDVINATDDQQSDIATAAIQDDADCTGNILGTSVDFARIAGGINIRQQGTVGTTVNAGNSEHRGGYIASTTPDWNGSSVGTRGGIRPYGATGNTYMRLFGEIGGGTDFGAVSVAARSTAAALQVPGDVAFHVPTADNKVYASWVDFSSGFHTGAAPLGAQAATQADSTASTVAGVVTDLNALLAKLRTAKLLAP